MFMWMKYLKVRPQDSLRPHIASELLHSRYGLCSTDNFLSPIFSPYLYSFEYVASRASSQWRRLLYIYIYVLGIFLLFFIKKYMFLSFHFFFWSSVEFPQQNIDHQTENGIGDKNCQWNCMYVLFNQF